MNKEFISIYLLIGLWLYFGMDGFYKMMKFVGKPKCGKDYLAFAFCFLLIIFGPIFMQTVYEVIIGYIEDYE